tara:strand:- start:420 stop:1304 length:885 start_codon:yes stop_codon:yes gene_type:complete
MIKVFGLKRILIVGCGDIGMKLISKLKNKFRVFAITTKIERVSEIRNAGATPILADLDKKETLYRLKGIANIIIHLAPPKKIGQVDERTKRLIPFLPFNCVFIYISTTGVYGDCHGKFINETEPVKPKSLRAKRRLDAEIKLRNWSKKNKSRLSILRVSGIYAENRLPVDRLKKITYMIDKKEDVYTNRIHADDLVNSIILSIFRSKSQRIYNIVDDSNNLMGDYFDILAKNLNLIKPKRLPKSKVESLVSPELFSFMKESRRISNERIKNELGLVLNWKKVEDFISNLSLTKY